VKQPLTDVETRMSVTDHLAENERLIMWNDLIENKEIAFNIENYGLSEVVTKGAIKVYRVEAVTGQEVPEMFLLKGEKVKLSLPAVALGDRIAHALKYKDLLSVPVVVSFVKEGERKAKVISVRKAEE
jgi:hypothetical protein